jgi:hypothetical protein
MATTTEFIKTQSGPEVLSGIATIDNGETSTLAIPVGGRAIVRLGIPTMTGTSLTFTVQDFPSTTLRNSDGTSTTITVPFRPLYDGSGNQVTVTATDDSVIDVPELSGVYAFKIVSSGAEAAARQIEVQCVGPYPTSPGVNSVEIEPGATVTANQGTAGATAWPVIAAPSTSAIYNGSTAVTPVFAAISGASSGDNTLVSADATKKIRVFALSVVAAGAVTVRFESAAGGTALTGVMSFAANGGYVLPFNPAGWFETAANQLLNMELGGAVQVSGQLTYGLV